MSSGATGLPAERFSIAACSCSTETPSSVASAAHVGRAARGAAAAAGCWCRVGDPRPAADRASATRAAAERRDPSSVMGDLLVVGFAGAVVADEHAAVGEPGRVGAEDGGLRAPLRLERGRARARSPGRRRSARDGRSPGSSRWWAVVPLGTAPGPRRSTALVATAPPSDRDPLQRRGRRSARGARSRRRGEPPSRRSPPQSTGNHRSAPRSRASATRSAIQPFALPPRSSRQAGRRARTRRDASPARHGASKPGRSGAGAAGRRGGASASAIAQRERRARGRRGSRRPRSRAPASRRRARRWRGPRPRDRVEQARHRRADRDRRRAGRR